MWLTVVLVAVLVVLNAAFAGSEMALVSLREGQVSRLEHRSSGGKILAGLVRDPNRFLATIQVGISLAGALASATAAVTLAEPLMEPLEFLGGFARPASIIIVTIVLTYVTLVLGELAPKRIAMQRAEGWAMKAARPLNMLATFTRPAVWLLSRSSDVVVRLFGVDPDQAREEVTEEELRDMLMAQESITPEQRQIMEGAFEIADRSLREVLRPRRDVVTVDATSMASHALRRLLEAGHSRAPVLGEGIDDVVGVVHVRELIDATCTTGELARPATGLPESLGVLDALRRLRAERQHLAVVVDEYGGVAGIVTLEDLLEEIVGEIYDETDRDVADVVHHDDRSLSVKGSFPVHDLVDVGVDLPEGTGEYATVAGLVLDALGFVPEAPGVAVDVQSWRLEVTEVVGRAITRVRLHPLEQQAGVSTDGDQGEQR